MSDSKKIAVTDLNNDIEILRKNFNENFELNEEIKTSFNSYFYIMTKYMNILSKIITQVDDNTKLKYNKVYQNWNEKFNVYRMFNYNIFMLIKSIFIMTYSNLLNSSLILIRNSIELNILGHWFIVNIKEIHKWSEGRSYPITGKNGVIKKISSKNIISDNIEEELIISISEGHYDDLQKMYRDYSLFVHGKISIFQDIVNLSKDKTYDESMKEFMNLFQIMGPNTLASMPILFDYFLVLNTYSAHILSFNKLFENKGFIEIFKENFPYFPMAQKIFSKYVL